MPKEPSSTPAVFAVKAADRLYTWEVRRFGAIVLHRGVDSYANEDLARTAGEAVLAGMIRAEGEIASR